MKQTCWYILDRSPRSGVMISCPLACTWPGHPAAQRFLRERFLRHATDEPWNTIWKASRGTSAAVSHQPGKRFPGVLSCLVPTTSLNPFHLELHYLIQPCFFNSTSPKHVQHKHKPSKHSLSGFWRFIKRVVLGRWLWTSHDSAPVVWPTSSTLPPVRCPRVFCTVCWAWQRVSVGRLRTAHTPLKWQKWNR